MKAAVVLLAALLALPALAGDCPCPEKAKPKAVKQEAQKTAPAHHYAPKPAPTFKAAGTWLMGAGPIVYKDFGRDSTKIGATVVVGYRLEHDWEILVGPTWTPHDDIHGMTCGVPFKVDAAKPIGAQFLAVYEF